MFNGSQFVLHLTIDTRVVQLFIPEQNRTWYLFQPKHIYIR